MIHFNTLSKESVCTPEYNVYLLVFHLCDSYAVILIKWKDQQLEELEYKILNEKLECLVKLLLLTMKKNGSLHGTNSHKEMMLQW